MPQPARGFLIAWIACILAIGVALCALIGRAHAAEIPCPTLEATQAAINARIAEVGGTSEMLSHDESQLYLAGLNAVPPESHLAGDRMLFLTRPDGRVLLGLVIGDKVCPVGSVASEVHDRVMGVVRGNRA